MSASALHIGRLRARYAVPAGGEERRRLDALLRAVVDDALDRAVERVGVGPGEHVCLRSLHVPVHLRLAKEAEAGLAEAWADAIATQLAARLRAGGPDVVRYGSKRHALADAAMSVAGGEHTRTWAWRQLRVWPAGDDATPAALVAALLDDPGAVAPVLAHVARAGRLPALATRLDAPHWRTLAGAALGAAGAAPGVSRQLEEAGAPATSNGSATPVAPLRRALARSAIAKTLPARAAPQAAVAALALVEVEPAAVAALSSTLVDAIAAATAAGDVEVDDAGAPREDRAAEVARPVIEARPADDEALLPDRVRVATDWGGLLFALHALAPLDVPTRLAGLSPAAALHALALQLVPAHETDPAVLAFAGLAPDAPRPDIEWDEEPAVLADVACRVHTWLAERLELDPDDLDRHAVLRRRAEIVADPGWVEVHLRLDEVDTGVRRAGLDLDPGWLPFIGCVVRLVYA